MKKAILVILALAMITSLHARKVYHLKNYAGKHRQSKINHSQSNQNQSGQYRGGGGGSSEYSGSNGATRPARTRGFSNMPGTWTMSSPKNYKSVTFAKDHQSARGSELTLEFNRQGKVRVNESGNVYSYRVNGGILEVAKDRRTFDLNRKNKYDRLKIIGKLDNGCLHVKYDKKGMGGYSGKDGYKMCKVEGMPQPTYQREPYNF